MYAQAAKKMRKNIFSQGIDPQNATFTSNSGPVSVFFISGELTGKERDPETGLYYYGERYLDPRTSRWISADPAMWEGDYIPGAPINDQARERNQNLPGMGGIFNYVNFHVYHYGGNNPVKLMDPDGRNFYNFTGKVLIVRTEQGDYVSVGNGQMYEGSIDGVILPDGAVIKVSYDENSGYPEVHVAMETIDGHDRAFLVGGLSINSNNDSDRLKGFYNIFARITGRNKLLLSGRYNSQVVGQYRELNDWIDNSLKIPDNIDRDNPNVRDMTDQDVSFARESRRQEFIERN